MRYLSLYGVVTPASSTASACVPSPLRGGAQAANEFIANARIVGTARATPVILNAVKSLPCARRRDPTQIEHRTSLVQLLLLSVSPALGEGAKSTAAWRPGPLNVLSWILHCVQNDMGGVEPYSVVLGSGSWECLRAAPTDGGNGVAMRTSPVVRSSQIGHARDRRSGRPLIRCRLRSAPGRG